MKEQPNTACHAAAQHDADCDFVIQLLQEFPCAAYEAYKNAPANIQSDHGVTQKYLESRMAIFKHDDGLRDYGNERLVAGLNYSPEGEARLAELLDRFEYYTDCGLSAVETFRMMRIERSEAYKNNIDPVELAVL
jgi:hypothetical protein